MRRDNEPPRTPIARWASYFVAPFLVSLFALFASGVARAEDDPGDYAAAIEDYQLGHGLRMGDTGLTIGGYVTGELAKPSGGPASEFVSNASLLTWWEGPHNLKVFSEIDFERGLGQQGSFDADRGQYLSLERLYLDYDASDSLTLRLGKFLTPIGRYNQIHADPLVWTTSRPLITQATFATDATGAMALGSVHVFGVNADYSFFVAGKSDVRPAPNVDPFRRAVGARLNLWITDHLQIGASLASFQQDSFVTETKRLAGMDFLWDRDGFELSGEAVKRLSQSDTSGSEDGFFVEGVAPIVDRLFIVGRYETFHTATAIPFGPVMIAEGFAGTPGFGNGEPLPPGTPMVPSFTQTAGATVHLHVIGLAYRYRPALVFKIEAVHADNNSVRTPVGVLASISVLF